MYIPVHDGEAAGYFPPEEELLVTSAPLKAAAFYLGDQCKAQNDDFMFCKKFHGGDPGKCLPEGRRVTNCTQHVFFQLHQHCYDQFTRYWKCLDNNNQKYHFCRDEEFTLESCVLDKLKWQKKLWVADRPEAGLKEHHDLPGVANRDCKHFVDSKKNPY